jgi:hypothetical protein
MQRALEDSSNHNFHSYPNHNYRFSLPPLGHCLNSPNSGFPPNIHPKHHPCLVFTPSLRAVKYHLLIVTFVWHCSFVFHAGIMANLHRAITNPVFGWYSKEIPCGNDLMPLDENYVPRKPDQIKISLWHLKFLTARRRISPFM